MSNVDFDFKSNITASYPPPSKVFVGLRYRGPSPDKRFINVIEAGAIYGVSSTQWQLWESGKSTPTRRSWAKIVTRDAELVARALA